MSSITEEFDHLKIQMEDIISATDNFDPNKLIGRGGFGQVYKGELSLLTGPTMVAFKRLDRRLGQGNIEFWKEILMLSNCKHDNLVSLLHFSIEGDERVLVYEYASRGSLDRHLSDGSLTWKQRLHICIGAAHALKYLHDPKKTQQRVLHRDIKSANILLDEQWTAKVSDFGLSKIGPANQPRTFQFTNAVGTSGYCDPLYWQTGVLSKESDVYSFGVVLFEVLCGRLCCQYRNHELTRIFVDDWIKSYVENKLDDIILEDLKEQIDRNSLITFSTIANQCLNRDRRERPTMDKIVKELEVALEQQNIPTNSNLVEVLKLVPPLSYRSHNELISLLSKGILVDEGRRWLSINKSKQINEMISATQCMHGSSFSHRSDKVSRFFGIIAPDVFKFRVEVRAQFLLPHNRYTMNLIFKRRIENNGRYVPFKYKLEAETDYLVSRLVIPREDGWLMAELFQFTSYQKEQDFKLEFLPYFTTACDFEGIEFRPMEHEIHENLEDKNKVGVEQILNSDADWEQELSPNHIDLINLSKDNVKWTTKKEMYILLRKGFLIYDGEDTSSYLWLSISKKMKIRLMIPAISFLNKKGWIWKFVPESRFEEVAESLDRRMFEITYSGTKSKQLFHWTTYTALLIYKLPENYPWLNNLIKMTLYTSQHRSYYDTRYFFLVPPPPTPIIQSMVDQNYDIPLLTPKIKGLPKLRKDGWMELPLFQMLSDDNIKYLKLSGSEHMQGLVIQGIELRSL